jgi:dTDP-4-dehydrorhamnose reductase
MRVLVVGASGLVGGNCFSLFRNDKKNHVVGTFLKFPVEGLLHFDPENDHDLSNEKKQKYDVIIHTAGFTNVDQCEIDSTISFKSNVETTSLLCDLAQQTYAKLVFISTDYIFNGTSGPYTEESKPDPLNVYGRHKLEAERVIAEKLSNYLILRVTNVYGDEARSKNFVSRLLMDAQSGVEKEIVVATDQYATPVNAYDIARSIEVLVESDSQGVYNIAGNEYISRLELAKMVIEKMPSNVKVSGKITTELNQIAKRPLRGGLLNTKFLKQFPNFKFEPVSDYLKRQAHV